MKKKPCLSVYIALLFLIFLVVVFPYNEGFENTTTSISFFDYYWPFSDNFLKSENRGSSSTEINSQGDTNIDSRTNNTAGYNDVDYKGFNTSGIGNDGKRYKY
jgi:hypothetical protein